MKTQNILYQSRYTNSLRGEDHLMSKLNLLRASDQHNIAHDSCTVKNVLYRLGMIAVCAGIYYLLTVVV